MTGCAPSPTLAQTSSYLSAQEWKENKDGRANVVKKPHFFVIGTAAPRGV
jgi:hypothetical protein